MNFNLFKPKQETAPQPELMDLDSSLAMHAQKAAEERLAHEAYVAKRDLPEEIFKNELKQVSLAENHEDWAVIPGTEDVNQERIAEYQNYAKQQNKLMAGLVGGLEAFANPPQISGEQKGQILDAISQGSINRGTLKSILVNIAGPEHQIGMTAMSERINGNAHQAKILDFLGGKPLEDGKANEAAIQNFLNKYPTPVDFDQSKMGFLRMIKNHNPREKYMEYVNDMKGFTKNMYGKKQEYFSQMLDLERQAEEKNGR